MKKSIQVVITALVVGIVAFSLGCSTSSIESIQAKTSPAEPVALQKCYKSNKKIPAPIAKYGVFLVDLCRTTSGKEYIHSIYINGTTFFVLRSRLDALRLNKILAESIVEQYKREGGKAWVDSDGDGQSSRYTDYIGENLATAVFYTADDGEQVYAENRYLYDDMELIQKIKQYLREKSLGSSL